MKPELDDDTIDEATKRAETRAGIIEALAEVEAKQDISFEEFLSRTNNFWKEKGIDFDAAFRAARRLTKKEAREIEAQNS